MSQALILGTRGSKMALAQTEQVMDLIGRARPNVTCTPRIIKTSGDWKPEDGEKRLSEAAGGKGLFVKEIEQAMLDGIVHAGVHSLKDVPSFLPAGLVLDHMLKRDDPRDMFIARTNDDIFTLPSGSVVGTASLRRQAVIKKLRPDLVVTTLRGNVTTRIEKLKSKQMDAMVVSYSGLVRLGVANLTEAEGLYGTQLDPSVMLPACGQGVIAIETIDGDEATRVVMDSIHHFETGLTTMAERTVLQTLDGDCRTPIGAYAMLNNGQMYVRAMIALPDGTESYQAERTGAVGTLEEARALAFDLAQDVRAHAPAGILPTHHSGAHTGTC